jgi:hypothetical protein
MTMGHAIEAARLVQLAMSTIASGEESTRAAIAQILTKQEAAEDARQQGRQRAFELRKQAAQLVAESLDVEDECEAAYKRDMQAAQDGLASIGEISTDDASSVRVIAQTMRSIPITSRKAKGNMQMVAQ